MKRKPLCKNDSLIKVVLVGFCPNGALSILYMKFAFDVNDFISVRN